MGLPSGLLQLGSAWDAACQSQLPSWRILRLPPPPLARNHSCCTHRLFPLVRKKECTGDLFIRPRQDMAGACMLFQSRKRQKAVGAGSDGKEQRALRAEPKAPPPKRRALPSRNHCEKVCPHTWSGFGLNQEAGRGQGGGEGRGGAEGTQHSMVPSFTCRVGRGPCEKDGAEPGCCPCLPTPPRLQYTPEVRSRRASLQPPALPNSEVPDGKVRRPCQTTTQVRANFHSRYFSWPGPL